MLSPLKNLLSSYLESIFVIAGIYTTYLYFGVLQEHIYTNPSRDTFIYPESVVFTQLFITFIVSTIRKPNIVLQISPEYKRDLPPLSTVLTYGGAFGYSMFLTNYSLTVISYPTQALAKSCKILPAMIGSLFVKGMKYHPLQYLSVVMITLGVVAFNYNNKKGETSDSWLGMIALLMSLMLDGLTSYFTETLKRVYNSTSLSAQQICSGFGALLTFPLVILKNFIFTDVTVLEYILKFPDVVPDILVFASFSAFGNYFIFWGLNLFGSLNLVIITTIRKFLTVLVSILYFRHSIDWIQALCIVFVVLGTALDVYVGHARDHKDVSHAGEQKDDKKKQEKVD